MDTSNFIKERVVMQYGNRYNETYRKARKSYMTIDNKDLLNSILASLDRIDYINPEEIPNIDLYMDQVTTFMDSRLRPSTRYPDEDKILTKTMINNYAKNNLLPPPIKKKYSKEHVLLLIFIYYYKGILSISDIQTLLKPITDAFFQNEQDFNLEDVYKEVFSMGKKQIQAMKEDVIRKFRVSQETFQDAPEREADFLRKFAFICALSLDVYVKRLMIEKMIDELAHEQESRESSEKTESRKAENKKKQ